jgi:hypothetical protein
MFDAILHGWSGLGFAYSAAQAPMILGLVRSHAQFHKYFQSPVIALPLAFVAGLGGTAAQALTHGLGIGGGSLINLAVSTVLSGWIGYTGGRVLAEEAATHKYQRGTVVRDVNSASPRARADRSHDRSHDPSHDRSGTSESRANGELTLAGVRIPALDETKHFKLIGTTGTGKSTAIRELLGGALARGDRAVIADPDGAYLERFYDARRGDVILNPFHEDSLKWDLFGEIDSPYDVEQLARSLIPDHDGQDRSWRAYARTFFTAVTRQMHKAGDRDMGELYRMLLVANPEELQILVKGTPAQPFLQKDNSRMFDSIRSVASSAIGALDYVVQQKSELLSVRQWIREGGTAAGSAGVSFEQSGKAVGTGATSLPSAGMGTSPHGVLFIPYKAGQIAALRSTISAWMRLAIFETMNQREGDSRLWFVVDELDALGQIDGLKDALARLRKFGGRCVLGFQSIAQVSGTYGQSDAHTIVENCSNTLILRCSASDGGGTARFASQLVGDREVVRITESRSRRATEVLGSKTLSEHFDVESALLPSQIEQLPDLAGYLKRASRPEWLRVNLRSPQLSAAAAMGKREGLVRATGCVPEKITVNASASAAADSAAGLLARVAKCAWRAFAASAPTQVMDRSAAFEDDRGLRGRAAHDDSHQV